MMALLASTAISFAPALAAEGATELTRQLQMLQEQLRSVQQQLEALKASDAASRAAIAKETETREAAEKAARDAALAAGGRLVVSEGKSQVIPAQNPKVVESGTHRFTLSSPDNAWTIAPTGRLHFDVGAYLSQKPESTTAQIGTTAGGRLSSGVNVRRARFGVTGRAMNDFTYSLILDAGGATDNATLINTAQIGYTGIRNTIFEAGYFSQYFTLEQSTSSNDIMFIEKSMGTNLATSFNTGTARSGAGFRTWGPNYWIGAYVNGSSVGQAHQLTKRTLGAFQRITFNPIQNDLQSVHIGAAVSELFKAPNAGLGTPETITLSDRPELRIDPSVLVNTGALGTLANPVTGGMVYNAESAAAFGGLFYQGEYFHYTVDRRGKTKAKFDAGYAMVSYTVGGRRTYTANCGCYSSVNPVTPFSPLQGGMGAFEFAARVSYADLTDQYNSSLLAAAQPNMVNGGRETNLTVGLNWYWNSNMRWMFNYIHANFDKANPRTATGNIGIPVGLSMDAIAARFQVVF